MKKLWRLMILGTFVCLFACFAVACEENGNDDDDDDPIIEDHELAGEYEIDITNLGMPLVFYLRIDTEGNFELSSSRDYDVDKGNGTVGQSGDTYMLIYSDSTPDEPKTATFTVENDNLHFSTTLPYGASNINYMREDDDDPEIIYYLVARIYMYEDYHGQYAGGHSVVAMGSSVDYEYTMTLKPGKEYDFLSTFEMGGTVYEFTEKGTYAIEDDVFTIVPEGQEEVVGSINPDGSLTIGVQASQMGSREERDLRVTTTSEYAGTYYGYSTAAMGGMTMYDTEGTLVLDQFGGYHYTAVDALSGEVEETGTYSVEGTEITYVPDDEEEDPFTGTIENLVVTATFYKSAEGGMRGELTFYSSTVQGEFTGISTVEEVQYDAVLDLASDGTFTLVISDTEGEILNTAGDFSVVKTMMLMVVLDSPEGTFNCVVSQTGLNASIEYEGVEYGFELGK